MEEELRFHLAMRTQENIARGMSAAEAAVEAQRQFGNITLLKDEWRDVSGGGALEIFWRDLRFAARMLAKDRALTVIAIVALMLGIGANTALFTVMSSVLLRPLPYPRSNELMTIWSTDSRTPESRAKVSFPDFLDLQSRNHTLHSLGAFVPGSFVINNNRGASAKVQGAYVTSDIFSMIEAKAELGRIFNRGDDEPGSRVVIISDKLWEERFARAANVTDATLTVEGQKCAVVGVMPRGFRFPVQNEDAQLWTTFGPDHEPAPNGAPAFAAQRDGHYLHLLGRLRAHSTIADAKSDLSAIAANLAATYPNTNLHFDACAVTPWLDDLTNKVRPALLMLIAAAACLLCVACANIANLLLARGSTRQAEIAVRAALGAGRRRILRQLLTESLLLAIVGGVAGLLFALVGTQLLVRLLPPDFPRASEIAPDTHVLFFAVIVTVITSCIFGFAPAWRSAHTDLAPILNDSNSGGHETRRSHFSRNVLMVTETVLSLVLLACACCLVENVWRIQNAPLGFNPENLITAKITLPNEPEGGEWSRVIAFSDQLLNRVRQFPGVDSATTGWPLPAVSTQGLVAFGINGRDAPKGDWPRARPRIVMPDYFPTMEIPIKMGRDFDARDTRHSAPVVIINQTLADKFFPNENPIGHRIIPDLDDDGYEIPEREIIGVVGDVKSDRFGSEQPPEVYVPYPQCISLELSLLIRSKEDPGTLLSAVGRMVDELDHDVFFYDASPLDEHLDLALAQPRLNSALLATFALVAVALTAIGVYGVMAYSVAQRRHEIGIRLALGAEPSTIFRLVLGQAARPIFFGIIAGTVASFFALSHLSRLAQHSLGNTVPTTAIVAIFVAGIAFVACWLPARRASRENPLAAIGLR